MSVSEGLKFDGMKRDEKIEKKYFEDLVVLGNAVSDEKSDNRKTVCAVAYSKEYGLIRIYPVSPSSPMKRWSMISIPLERNRQDNRDESWKVQGSKTEWDTHGSDIKIKYGSAPNKGMIASETPLTEAEEDRQRYERAIRQQQADLRISRAGAIRNLARWGVYPPKTNSD